MLIDCKGKYGKFITLGVQTNKDKVQEASIKMANEWAPNRSKSFTISRLTHTDYHGLPVPIKHPTGYATIEVYYYTTEKEGEHLLFKA